MNCIQFFECGGKNMCVTILFYKIMGKNPWFIVRFHLMNVIRDIQRNTTHMLSFMTMEPKGINFQKQSPRHQQQRKICYGKVPGNVVNHIWLYGRLIFSALVR